MLSAAHVPLLLNGIIALVVVEMIGLELWRRARGSGMATREIVSFLGAGLCLLLALRVVSTNGPFVLFALAMLGSLVLHVVHAAQRWSRDR